MPPSLPPRVPQPSHRHGAPSGPWPFLDLDSEIDSAQVTQPPQPPVTQESDWSKYPQSLFPNWTPAQLQKSGITTVTQRKSREACTIHNVNILSNGTFVRDEDQVVTEDNCKEYWKQLQRDLPEDVRLRALFVDNLSGPVLQMLGTRYCVEPFFFSSSLNWIPARYQEAVGEGDHITITLTFIRSMQNPMMASPNSASLSEYSPTFTLLPTEQVIDTHAPLLLDPIDRILLPDILAIHMVRSPERSTIISYHPPRRHQTTAAQTLRTRLLAAGQSVYWNKIFSSTVSSDPTFVLLALLWYPLYAFDEALDALYNHICWLESRVMGTTDMLSLTQQLHVVRAHLLHYASLLEDFRRSVLFIAQTSNPNASDQHASELMRKETANLLDEIARLEQSRNMQGNRLKNAMNLAFSSVNLEDSRTMRRLTEATVRDSAAMKQISYLTMFFLPASFAAALFGMNIKEITPGTNGTIGHYLAVALPLTAFTVWVIMMFQYRKKDPTSLISDVEHDKAKATWSKLWWPVMAIRNRCRRAQRRGNSTAARASRPNSRPNSMRPSSKALQVIVD